MPGNDRIDNARQFSVEDVQISPAHATGIHPDTNMAGSGCWIIAELKPERRTGRPKNHRVHVEQCPMNPVQRMRDDVAETILIKQVRLDFCNKRLCVPLAKNSYSAG